MSLLNPRLLLAFTLALGLAACGFTPAFGPAGPASALRGTIALADTNSRDGFEFIKRMEERLGRATAARFDLDYQISSEKSSLGFTPDGAITRFNLAGTVTWTLKDRATAQVVANGVEQNFTAWSATGVTIAAVNAESDAKARLIRILADQVIQRLVALSPQLTAGE